MELNQLRHFVAVAEELHFGRAAARLGMAQPPLSQSIRRLESSLELLLFERSSRKVTVTPSGRVFLEEARRIIDQVDLAIRLAQRAGKGELDRLRIGFTPTALFGILPRVVQEFRKRWPGVNFKLEEHGTLEQIAQLLNGNLDVGFLIHHGDPIERLSMRPISRAPHLAAVPSSWPIARRKKLRLADLGPYPFISIERSRSPEIYAAMNAACRAAGFVPNVVQHATWTYTTLSLVANEIGVALVQDAARFMPFDGLTLLPIADLPSDVYSEASIAWLPQATSPTQQAFIAIAEEVLTTSSGKRKAPKRR